MLTQLSSLMVPSYLTFLKLMAYDW
ncbi:hypothetical protein NC652_000702 [Populus alba x Populus x berolinensis]|nr:hypothetical protein NC652_000702 [Populus alba x Populus x berolinensis]